MEQIINDAVAYIKALFGDDSGGHDAAHTLRVYRTAVRLAELEGADPFVCALAALLHDADDVKLSPDTAADKTNARRFLRAHGADEALTERIVAIIDEVSFRGSDSVTPSSPEGCCVQDADRLDAIGAVGVARTFAYGGAHGRRMYDPDEPPALNMDAAAYRARRSCTVNHFYEKLFLLKDKMNTPAARALAERRDRFMHAFLEEFFAEWQGEA